MSQLSVPTMSSNTNSKNKFINGENKKDTKVVKLLKDLPVTKTRVDMVDIEVGEWSPNFHAYINPHNVPCVKYDGAKLRVTKYNILNKFQMRRTKIKKYNRLVKQIKQLCDKRIELYNGISSDNSKLDYLLEKYTLKTDYKDKKLSLKSELENVQKALCKMQITKKR